MGQKFKNAITRLWHWIIATACLAGLCLCFLLGRGFYRAAYTEAETGSPFLWWGLLAGTVVFAVVLLWELWRRFQALRPNALPKDL